MSDPVERSLNRIARVGGVRGAMVVDADAGVPVAGSVDAALGETALAALAGSLYRRSTEATTTSGYGRVRILQLETKDGHLVVAGAGALLVVALLEPEAQLGLARIEAARAAGELMQ